MEQAVYIVMRRDLKLRRGKEMAQACHAMKYIDFPLGTKSTTALIGCKVHSLEDLEDLQNKCLTNAIEYVTITDAAKTELPGPTKTCIAIGPVERDKYDFLNELELY